MRWENEVEQFCCVTRAFRVSTAATKDLHKKTFIQNKSVQSLNLYTLDLYSKIKILHNLNTNFTKITILKQVTKL